MLSTRLSSTLTHLISVDFLCTSPQQTSLQESPRTMRSRSPVQSRGIERVFIDEAVLLQIPLKMYKSLKKKMEEEIAERCLGMNRLHAARRGIAVSPLVTPGLETPQEGCGASASEQPDKVWRCEAENASGLRLN